MKSDISLLFRSLYTIMIIGCGMSMISCIHISRIPAWKQPPVKRETGNSKALMVQAEALIKEADNKEKTESLLRAFEAVIRSDPDNRRALEEAATYSILLATGYTEDLEEKAALYQKAIQYSELSMYQNPEFRKFVDGGGEVWDGAKFLNKKDSYAMGWWTTAVFYYYREALGKFSKIVNFEWVKRARALMTRIEEVDPDWEGGGNYFSWGIYYLALPEDVGGDMEKSLEYLKKGINVEPGRLVHRWGRAKYYYAKLENKEGFIQDLEWVIEQDPHGPGNPFPWNVYFQKQAKEMLDSPDDYLGQSDT